MSHSDYEEGFEEGEAMARAGYGQRYRSRIKELEDEVASLKAEASAHSYRGNTAHHWWAKATAYGKIVHGCTPALEAAGYHIERGPSGPAASIADAVASLVGKNEVLKYQNEALRAANERFDRGAKVRALAQSFLETSECSHFFDEWDRRVHQAEQEAVGWENEAKRLRALLATTPDGKRVEELVGALGKQIEGWAMVRNWIAKRMFDEQACAAACEMQIGFARVALGIDNDTCSDCGKDVDSSDPASSCTCFRYCER